MVHLRREDGEVAFCVVVGGIGLLSTWLVWLDPAKRSICCGASSGGFDDRLAFCESKVAGGLGKELDLFGGKLR